MSQALAERTAGATSLPPELTSPRSKLVYLYLDTVGRGSVDDLHEALNLKKISLCPVLESLVARGVVERHDQQYRIA